MIVLKDYQNTAYKKIERFITYKDYAARVKPAMSVSPLSSERNDFTGDSFNIQVDAPTGAGKTVLMGKVITGLLTEYVTLWLTPGTGGLHEQTFARLKEIAEGSPSTRVKQIVSQELTQTPQPGDCYVVNWEQLVSRNRNTGEYKNTLMRAGDATTFFDWVEDIGDRMLPVALIIDESHYGKSSDAKAIKSFMQDFSEKLGYPPLLVEVSATPLATDNRELVKIPTSDVIKAGVIRKSVRLNAMGSAAENIATTTAGSKTALIDAAMGKMQELDEEYKRVGAYDIIDGKHIPYHSLVAVQLPNGAAGKETLVECEAHLRNKYGYTRETGEVAVYMMSDKSKQADTLKDIASPASLIKVLFYKQAISTGWDCPRAQILVGFKGISSHVFARQNIGRFLRTTQLKHYDNDLLDHAYVYSNVGDLGTSDFGKDIYAEMTYEKESILRVRETDAHQALASFVDKLPISHYSAKSSTSVPFSELFVEFEKRASKLKEKEYKTDSGLSIQTRDFTVQEIYGETTIQGLGATTKIVESPEEKEDRLTSNILRSVKSVPRVYEGVNKLVNVLRSLLIEGYKDGNEKTIHSYLEELERSTGQEPDDGDVDEFAIQQLLAHDDIVDMVVRDVLNSSLERHALDNEESLNTEFRTIINDGHYNPSTQQFFVNENGVQVGDAQVGDASKYAIHLATNTAFPGRTIREGVELSGPERDFEKNFIRLLGDDLAFYYKNPENKKEALRFAVPISETTGVDFYPDYLLELELEKGVFSSCVVEIKDRNAIDKAEADVSNITRHKAEYLVRYSADQGVKACVAYQEGDNNEWWAVTGFNSHSHSRTPLREYLTSKK